jgi:hypothetical protein
VLTSTQLWGRPSPREHIDYAAAGEVAAEQGVRRCVPTSTSRNCYEGSWTLWWFTRGEEEGLDGVMTADEIH